MFDISPDGTRAIVFDLGVLVAVWVCTQCLDPRHRLDRYLFGSMTLVLIGAYATWRWRDTLVAIELSFESLWQHIYLAFEAVAVLYTMMSIVILFRTIDRSGEADIAQAALTANGQWPRVDVFICTYNEPIDVLEKSILLSSAMDYPDLRIWVLDDTRRAWLKEYCDDVGVNYLTRPSNEWAKAGNLNNGLRLTAGPEAAPLILVLDADFAPNKNFLRRTVGLFGDPKTGLVQTPQLYFNADPVQHNLMASKAWVDDQRIFFDVFQPAKDAWDSAFCVGTSFVVRRDRVEEIGGFPHEAVSEDINLTYTLLQKGYVTRWLNEPLSIGLAAEGLPEYITQRARWCLGTIQVALLKTGPFRARGLTLVQRLHYFHGLLNWLSKPFIILMLIAPSVYWFLDTPAFQADYPAFLRHAVPALLGFYAFSGWISGRRTLPVFMEVTHMITAVAISWTLITCCYRPFGRPFKVTDKGGDRSQTIARWDMLLIFGALSLSSCAAIVWALVGPNAPTEASSLDILNLVWAGVAILLSGIACLVCFERPRLHREENFAADVIGSLCVDGRDVPCLVARYSTFDAELRQVSVDASHALNAVARVNIPVVGSLPGVITRRSRDGLHLALTLSEAQRRTLLVHLYGNPQTSIPLQASMFGAIRGLMSRAASSD